jgi:FlaA1/EpsC-like NDP-sugar epimerase
LLRGKAVLITGGEGSIGMATARATLAVDGGMSI